MPFVDVRRPFRLLHLDLLVLLAFGVSHVFFNRGDIGASVPLVYPVLLYLLGRLLLRRLPAARPRSGPLVPHLPLIAVGLGLVFLVTFRIGLNVADSNVIDVGYAGVIGADRIVDGDELYGEGFSDDVERGDTYGPVNYLFYVPVRAGAALGGQLGRPARGARRGDRHRPARDRRAAAARAAPATRTRGDRARGRARLRVGGLSLHGVRARARTRTTRSWRSPAWPRCSRSRWRGASSSGAWSGVAIALGAAAKFVPLALAPLFARRAPLWFAAALALTLAAVVLPFIPDGGLRELYDRTVGYQVSRPSPFSIWGQVESLDWLQLAMKIGVAGLALLVAFVPRRVDARAVAALGGAVLIALQLTATHWFYLYIVWFVPFALVALFAGGRVLPAPKERAPEPERELVPA